MANDINRVTLIGRFTRDPELKFTPNNTPISNFSWLVITAILQTVRRKSRFLFSTVSAGGKAGR